MSRVVELVTKAVRHPDRIAPYLDDILSQQLDRFRYRLYCREYPEQKARIRKFIEQDEFLLIVLDSCRFDYFEEEVTDYLSGSLQKVCTPATFTIDYTRTMWDGNHDLTYVTGMPAPTDYSFERKGYDFRPSEHIDKFVHVWQTCNEKELGAVPPEAMTDAALKQQDERMVVHYVQPHAPYIGDYRLRDSDQSLDWDESLKEIYQRIGRYDSEGKTITDKALQQAYRSNLQRVLKSVRHLVERFDRPAVVTADHGELLGENGRYIHGGGFNPILNVVPWFVVDESIIGQEPLETEPLDQSGTLFSDRDVEEQLAKLGYL